MASSVISGKGDYKKEKKSSKTNVNDQICRSRVFPLALHTLTHTAPPGYTAQKRWNQRIGHGPDKCTCLEIGDFDKDALGRSSRVGDVDVAALGVNTVVNVLSCGLSEPGQVDLREEGEVLHVGISFGKYPGESVC